MDINYYKQYEPIFGSWYITRLIGEGSFGKVFEIERDIAINDGVDSEKGDNDFPPFRNLFNDFYARDTSKKIRAVMRAKGNAGEHLCSNPPYGYIKDPADTDC